MMVSLRFLAVVVVGFGFGTAEVSLIGQACACVLLSYACARSLVSVFVRSTLLLCAPPFISGTERAGAWAIKRDIRFKISFG